MTQLSLIDPRGCPIATAEMLDDAGLRAAIATVRKQSGVDPALLWPYVERLSEIGKRPGPSMTTDAGSSSSGARCSA